MKCLWIYITLHTCTYFDPMICFQLQPPPAGPPESCKSAAATVLIQGIQVQAQLCLIFHASSFIPPGRCRRPQLAAAGAATAVGAAAAAAGCRRGGCSGGRPASWQRLPPLQPWQLAAPASGSVIWTTTMSWWNSNLEAYGR